MRSRLNTNFFHKKWALYLLFSLFVLSASAQRYTFYNLNVENGLIQSQATCLTQDKYGNLWIGTIGGISRYDGKNFTNYTVRDGLLSNTINALVADAQGELWIGHSEGLSRFDGNHFTHYFFPAADKKTHIPVNEIRTTGKDSIWCRAGGNLYSIFAGKIKRIELPSGKSDASAFLTAKNGLYLSATDGLVYQYTNQKWSKLYFTDTLAHPLVLKFYSAKSSGICLTTNRGLYKLEGDSITSFKVAGTALVLPSILSITEDNSGSLWLGTNTGVIRLKDGNSINYNKHNGLSDNVFNDLFTDLEGNIWMASDGQGIFRYSGTQFTALDESMGLPGAQVMAIAHFNDRIFLGTYDAGLYEFNDGKVNAIPFPNENAPRITAMANYKGKLWIGTRGRGLWTYDGEFSSEGNNNFSSSYVSSLYNDTAGRLWIGFANGAILYEHDTFKKVSLNGLTVYDFISVGADSILIATNAGLKLYNAGFVYSYKTHAAPDSTVPQCFTLRGKELWIGTSDNGVICYNLETKKSFGINKRKGLRSDFIYNIATDNENNIWLGTGYGIHRISRKENGEPVITFYGKEQGVSGMESNQKAVLKLKDGSIWFGTTHGALHYIPHSETVQAQPISVVLQSIKLFGENISNAAWYDTADRWYGVPFGLRLPHQKNNITFNFQAITLSGGQHLLYRYRVDGLDAPWSQWSATNAVTYSALPPGNYTFHVQCNLPGKDNKVQELVYPFEIITPFQKTKWFSYVVIALCILLGIAFQYLVNKQKQRRQKLLQKLRSEEQAKIRLRTAEDFHDEIGNKLTRINVLTNVLRTKLDKPPDDINRILDQVEDNSLQLYSGTQDILWSLQPANDNLYEILYRIRDFGLQLFNDTGVSFVFTGDDEKWKEYRLPLDLSRNLIMIFKEALNNSLKYSKATTVKLEISLKKKDVLQMLLTDNGIGFDVPNAKKGHGINNMNVRAGRINGRLYFDSRPGKGTIITLTFKLPTKK